MYRAVILGTVYLSIRGEGRRWLGRGMLVLERLVEGLFPRGRTEIVGRYVVGVGRKGGRLEQLGGNGRELVKEGGELMGG